jgi:hypothetical protein
MTFISQTALARSTPDIVLTNVDCDPSVVIGDWVRMSVGNILVKAQADTKDNSNVIGLVESKATSVLATVRVLGVSEPLFTGLDVTKEYFLSAMTAGSMVAQGSIDANASGNAVLKLGQPFSDTRMLVLKGERRIRA